MCACVVYECGYSCMHRFTDIAVHCALTYSLQILHMFHIPITCYMTALNARGRLFLPFDIWTHQTKQPLYDLYSSLFQFICVDICVICHQHTTCTVTPVACMQDHTLATLSLGAMTDKHHLVIIHVKIPKHCG